MTFGPSDAKPSKTQPAFKKRRKKNGMASFPCLIFLHASFFYAGAGLAP